MADPKQIRSVLLRAERLLGRRGAWARDDYAFDKFGDRVAPDSKNAVCWCAIGAIQRFTNDIVLQAEAETAVEKAIGARVSLGAWNDRPGRTATQVRSAFRKAARLVMREKGR
jgi:hypothetical protein